MRTAARILATRVWWRHVLDVTNDPSLEVFLTRFSRYAALSSGYGLDPRLPAAWESGKTYVTEGTVRRVEGSVPGTKHVFLLGQLLEPNRQLSAPKARQLVSEYTFTDKTRVAWRFPNDARKEGIKESPPIEWSDSDLLAQRGDVFGLLAILALLREAMAAWSSIDEARRHAKNLYRALPPVLRLQWVMPDVDLLLQCIEELLVSRRRLLALNIAVNWDSLRAEVLDAGSESGSQGWVGDLHDSRCRNWRARPVPLLPNVTPLKDYVRVPASTNHAQVEKQAKPRGRLLDDIFGPILTRQPRE